MMPSAAPPAAAPARAATPPSMVDGSSPEAFIRSVGPYAARVSKATGIPVEVLIGMAANETGFGRHAPGNNLFGIKGTGSAGSFNSQTWEDYGQGAVTIRDNFRAYHSPAESFLDFATLVMTSSRYKSAMGETTVEGFVGALKRGGYMTDPEYVQKISNISTRYAGVIRESVGPVAVETVAARRVPVAKGVSVPDQFGVGLPKDEAMAACGPVAAIAFAQAYGRMPSPTEAMALAKQSGWTAAGGMNGIANEKRLLDKLGLPARLEYGVNWETVKAEAVARNPVIISTPAHYWVVDDFDPKTGKYHVGQSGKAYRGGSDWMTAEQIAQIGGGQNGALYAINPWQGQAAASVPAQIAARHAANGAAMAGRPSIAGPAAAAPGRPSIADAPSAPSGRPSIAGVPPPRPAPPPAPAAPASTPAQPPPRQEATVPPAAVPPTSVPEPVMEQPVAPVAPPPGEAAQATRAEAAQDPQIDVAPGAKLDIEQAPRIEPAQAPPAVVAEPPLIAVQRQPDEPLPVAASPVTSPRSGCAEHATDATDAVAAVRHVHSRGHTLDASRARH